MTCEKDGYVDGELWFAHQGVEVIEWPPLENCVTIDAQACEELRAVFALLGDQIGQTVDFTPEPVPASVVMRNMVNAIESGCGKAREKATAAAVEWLRNAPPLVASEPPKPWPFPTGKAPDKGPEPAKPAIGGLLTQSDGRYMGLGFNGE